MDKIELGAASDREFYDREDMGTRQAREVFMTEISSHFSAYSDDAALDYLKRLPRPLNGTLFPSVRSIAASDSRTDE